MPDNLSVETLGVLGTANVMNGQNASGCLPTRNYVTGEFEGAEAISGETIADTILKKRDTCYACIARCRRVDEAEWQGSRASTDYGGPEFKTLRAFGAARGPGDLQVLVLANQLPNQDGAERISAGATIALAVDCFEHRPITTADKGGMELRFGDRLGRGAGGNPRGRPPAIEHSSGAQCPRRGGR